MVLSKDMKIAICFGLIIGALFSLFGLCYASSDDVDIVSGSGLGISGNSPYSIVNISNTNYLYFYLEEGTTYRIYFDTDIVYGFTTQEPAAGVSIDQRTYHSRGGSIDVVGSGEYMYFYGFLANNNTPSVSVSIVDPGLNNFVDTLISSINTEGLWSTFLYCVPLLAISVLWGLGVYVLVKVILKIIKAKGGV